ncbi:hypothetical protein [Streptomyces sp. SP18CS02]|uniref:hypothetical protein n=1 Tax=Streptomyces sp. SP18CS02 TaxID=3002531 RepID=UPI002E79668B|nr:hypothetical protein [Streptomyces sp. SP18CS02]MEE1757008.1 hypothetical protein [Streptomyces sp. SP18CS02]
MRGQRVGMLLSGLVAVAVAMFGVPVGYFVFVYGCGKQEDRLAETIAGDPVLADGPAGAGEGTPYQGCDDDDLFVYAGKDYPYGASRQGALAHYQESARAHGWRPRTAPGEAPADCFTKRIGGTTAYLTLEGPDDGALRMEIVADRADSDWC